MQAIDREALNSDLHARIAYLTDFIQFDNEDIQALKDVAPLATPHIASILDAVYTKLFSYDITKRAFLERNNCFNGELSASLHEVSHSSEQIKFRKDFLRTWIVKLLTGDYKSGTNFEYLDKVGLMHTGAAGFKHREKKTPLHVDYIHMGMLLGWVQSSLTTLVLRHDGVSLEDKTRMVVALTKILWIANDLTARHYIQEGDK